MTLRLGQYQISEIDINGNALAGVYHKGKLIHVGEATLVVVTDDPEDIVTFDAGAVSGNTTTVVPGTVVHVSVIRAGHVPYSGTYTVTHGQSISVSLVKNNYTLTVNPTPSDASVSFSTGAVTGKSVTVPYETNVTYTVTRTGYATQTTTVQVLDDTTVNVNLVPNNYTFTINPTPSDSTVTLTATGYTQSGNSITVPYNTSVHYKVEHALYTTQELDVTVTEDETRNITLGYAPYTANQVIYQAEAATSQTLNILVNGYYKVELVGAGGRLCHSSTGIVG